MGLGAVCRHIHRGYHSIELPFQMRTFFQDGGWNVITVLEQPQSHVLSHIGNTQGKGKITRMFPLLVYHNYLLSCVHVYMYMYLFSKGGLHPTMLRDENEQPFLCYYFHNQHLIEFWGSIVSII